jgi:hypothetical protein
MAVSKMLFRKFDLAIPTRATLCKKDVLLRNGTMMAAAIPEKGNEHD